MWRVSAYRVPKIMVSVPFKFLVATSHDPTAAGVPWRVSPLAIPVLKGIPLLLLEP